VRSCAGSRGWCCVLHHLNGAEGLCQAVLFAELQDDFDHAAAEQGPVRVLPVSCCKNTASLSHTLLIQSHKT
jgi:hypothetical protein